jgi:hypothetical protein
MLRFQPINLGVDGPYNDKKVVGVFVRFRAPLQKKSGSAGESLC